MTARIKDDLDACGLEVVRVSSAEFTGDEYEERAQQLGELETKRLGMEVDVEDKRREAEYRAALRQLASREEMDFVLPVLAAQYREQFTRITEL